MELNINQFVKDVQEYCGINLNKKELEDFKIFYQFLIEENEKYNQTGITEEFDVYYKHFLDSLTLAKTFPITNQHIYDLGTGGGFPGVPLKICFPDTKVYLVDGSHKKINFLELLKEKLNLKFTFPVCSRFEQIKIIENNPIVVSRATGSLKDIFGYSSSFLKQKGVFIIQKGKSLENKEIDEILNLHKSLTFKKVHSFELPYELGQRNIYIFINTPKK